MAYFAILEDFQDFEAWQRGFEAAGFQFGWIVRHVLVTNG
jgi:hypothetical protein